MTLEQRLSKIDFLGEDGFHWFIGQVTVDANWREFSEKYGYRAKVRIFGHHPASDEVKDEELPWAQFLVPPNLGAGKNFGGTSFALQGGETCIGFFFDGEDAQQPVILGALFSSQSEKGLIPWDQVLEKFTSGFKPVEFNRQLAYSPAVKPADGTQPTNGGGIPSGGDTADGRQSLQGKINNDVKEKVVGKSKKCKKGKGATATIARSLQTFIRAVQGLKAYKGAFIDPALNQFTNIRGLVSQTASVISGAFTQLIRLARKFLFQKIFELVKNIVSFLIPDSLLKDIAVKKAVDQIFCLIENIIKGLQKFIEDFLLQMIGKIVNVPLCAAEQFIGGLISQITEQVNSAIGPALGSIQQAVGSALGSFTQYMDQALNYAQTALNFLKCEGSICEPEPYNWAVNFGPTQEAAINFRRTIDISGRIDNLNKDVKNTIDGWFGPTPDANTVQNQVGGCNPYSFECGPPRIEIFGGGGASAAARAVVNSIGQVVGVNMTELGFGYTSEPFVSIIDDCDNGYGATGRAIIRNGQVVNIIIDQSGGEYIPASPVTPDSEGIDVIGQIEDVEIVNTGIGYEEGDMITSDCGVLKPQLDEDGRVVGADIISSDVGCKVIPDLRINSPTGFGAIIRPVMRYIPRSEFKGEVPASGVIRVVNCVSS